MFGRLPKRSRRRSLKRISRAKPSIARSFATKTAHNITVLVAEAIFNAQFSIANKTFKLKLEKGRSKEDVAYTRLFEDFHPGGGPEDAISQSLIIRRPDFLSESRLKNYIYKKDSTIRHDDHTIYVIGFDQQPGTKQALEKGTLYIDADDFTLLQFKASNSPRGTPYIKSLKGSDKIFAEILHIDLSVKGWTRTATFTRIGDRLFLAYAKMDYMIDYKQSKKQLDLHLLINTEWMTTDFQRPLITPIRKGEEWKRKNLVANLPTDFDSTFWGSNNILSPTNEIRNIIDSLSKKNNDLSSTVSSTLSSPASPTASPDPSDSLNSPYSLNDWKYLNKEFFIARQHADTLTLTAIGKCSWEDNQTGGMIYKQIPGDFSIVVKLSITKRSDPTRSPDNGFQQAGLILRAAAGKEENHIIFSMGSGGNDIPKYFFKTTLNGKTKGLVDKTDSLTGWLRIDRRGKLISVYERPRKDAGWSKLDGYELDWAKDELQAGFSIMARFAGNGPKQRPDIKAIFSNIKIMPL